MDNFDYKKYLAEGRLFKEQKIDTTYWAEYNQDTSHQSPKHYSEKSQEFESAFKEAIAEWNNEAELDSKIEEEETQEIRKMAEEFFNIENWISINIIHAMISQNN